MTVLIIRLYCTAQLSAECKLRMKNIKIKSYFEVFSSVPLFFKYCIFATKEAPTEIFAFF